MSEIENNAVEVKAPVAKIDAAAEKAYAEASAKVAEAPKPEAAPATAKLVKAAPASKTTAAPKTKAPVAKQAALAKKSAAKTVRKAAPKKTATKPAAKKPVLARLAAAPSVNPVIKLKDTIMATAKNTDIAATAKEMLADVQARAQTVYTKGTVLAAEAGEFSKANVDAVVESGRIFFSGAQELLKDNIETGKTVIETVTEDAKKVAAIKSPTELMQLQNEIVRRNFDAMVSYGSKRTEAWVKLYNEAFAPISNRVSVAAEKIKTAA